MNLSERLKSTNGAGVGAGAPAAAATASLPGPASDAEIYHQLKSVLHARIVDRLDLETINRLPEAELKGEIGSVLAQLVSEGELPLNRNERAALVQELLDEMLGLGPLESLLRDLSISDIL